MRDSVQAVDITDITAKDQAARIRAAVGYSGLDYKDVAANALGKSAATLRRRASATKPEGAKSMDELYAIADECGVPRVFMEEGWARYDSDASSSIEQRVRDLELAVNALQQQPRADAPPPPPGALGHELSTDPPNDESHRGKANLREADSPQGSGG